MSMLTKERWQRNMALFIGMQQQHSIVHSLLWNFLWQIILGFYIQPRQKRRQEKKIKPPTRGGEEKQKELKVTMIDMTYKIKVVKYKRVIFQLFWQAHSDYHNVSCRRTKLQGNHMMEIELTNLGFVIWTQLRRYYPLHTSDGEGKKKGSKTPKVSNIWLCIARRMK